MLNENDDIVNKLKERIKVSKQLYGLSYTRLANTVGISPITLYNFLSGRQKLSKKKQVDILIAMEIWQRQFMEVFNKLI